ncbi:MAG: hypothetical protein AB1546_16845 [bacterium]
MLAGAADVDLTFRAVLDFNADGKLVGIDIDHACHVVNLYRLEAESLSISSLSIKK